MDNLSIIIPAQESNKYHKQGDLAPFGDTTLLEWKISQILEFRNPLQIYISSSSTKISEIAEKEGVNFIPRPSNLTYPEMIKTTIRSIPTQHILWANPTSPFIDKNTYLDMYNRIIKSNKSSMVSVQKKNEYVFFNDEKLNFSETFLSREDINPIYIMTNGCYIIDKEEALEVSNIVGINPSLYEVDSFTSIEIKDVFDYNMANQLISIYFRKEFDV